MSGAIAIVFISWLAVHGSAFPFEPADPLVILRNRKYLSQTLSFSEDQLDKKVSKCKGVGKGSILTLDTGVLEERVHWLTSRLDLKKNEMKKIAQRQPDILGRLPDENLSPKFKYLQTRLLLNDKSLRKLILTVPNVLTFSTEDNVVPKLDWLQQRLNLEDAALSKMIQKCPTLFCYSVETNIEPTLHWLQQRLNLNDAQLSKMIQKYPSVLTCNVDTNVKPTLYWLQQRLDLNDASVSEMIQKMPTLLGCNIDTNLKPTLDFYINALGDEEEALCMVVPDPSLFTYSLKNRLNPRLKEAQDAGLMIDSGCLKCIAKYTNDRWTTKMGN